MKDLFNFFDEYTLKARFLPAGIACIPLLALIASYFDWNKFLLSNVIVGILIGFLLIFLLSGFARYMGKKVEKKSLITWQVLPSTELMRHRDTSLDVIKKNKVHQLLTQKSPFTMPSQQEEIADPNMADSIYNEAMTWLRGKTRDEKILFNENINYGFMRNSLGLKWIALIICLISLLILTTLFFLNYDGSLKDFNQLTLFIKKVKMALWLTLAASLLMPLYWSLVINKANVRKSAVNYAKTLIDLVYKV
ncbi:MULTISPECIES: hypothetical protein [Acinetobacter calcoaceticus/baumannii complex]|uniref:hypothetical protein n=1 Tax=Acinetobacter calcoaceticus/baumannii complex TaxID=909768 RepID=UPI001189C680|nr:hypothetical protein [Acinetobacter baumannii]MCZ3370819.1 hypothetical protein [Acinetobacter baumannii]MDR0078043.1 hypothetical protein [Acinetobacter baumannii]QDX16357.1 hypothetical protein C6W84_16989 [Acinetobacter baumannii]UAS49244.1 hypothetical protein K9O37_18715 [Acinetobacter baumannii]